MKILSSFADMKAAKDKADADKAGVDTAKSRIQVRNFFDMSYLDSLKNPGAYERYNAAVRNGLSEAEEIRSAAQNHKHPDHKDSHIKFMGVDYDFDRLREDCVNRSIVKNQAEKLHLRNGTYEQKLLRAVQPSNGENYNADSGTVAKYQDHMRDHWNKNGYADDVSVTESFLAKNRLVTAIVSLENVRKVVEEFFGMDKVRANYDLLTPSKFANSAARKMDQLRTKKITEEDIQKRHGDFSPNPDGIGSNNIARKMDQLRKKK